MQRTSSSATDRLPRPVETYRLKLDMPARKRRKKGDGGHAGGDGSGNGLGAPRLSRRLRPAAGAEPSAALVPAAAPSKTRLGVPMAGMAPADIDYASINTHGRSQYRAVSQAAQDAFKEAVGGGSARTRSAPRAAARTATRQSQQRSVTQGAMDTLTETILGRPSSRVANRSGGVDGDGGVAGGDPSTIASAQKAVRVAEAARRRSQPGSLSLTESNVAAHNRLMREAVPGSRRSSEASSLSDSRASFHTAISSDGDNVASNFVHRNMGLVVPALSVAPARPPSRAGGPTRAVTQAVTVVASEVRYPVVTRLHAANLSLAQLRSHLRTSARVEIYI